MVGEGQTHARVTAPRPPPPPHPPPLVSPMSPMTTEVQKKTPKATPNKTKKTPNKTPNKHRKTPKKNPREHDDDVMDEEEDDRKRFRAGKDTTVTNLLARLQTPPETGCQASCPKCLATEHELKVARAHCALLSWQHHDPSKPLPSSLVEFQFRSITGEPMTNEQRDELKKMLPEGLRE